MSCGLSVYLRILALTWPLFVGFYLLTPFGLCLFVFLQVQQTLQQPQQAVPAAPSYSTPQTTIDIQVPNDRMKYVIGKGGTTIKDLMARTRTKIVFPSDDWSISQPTRTVSITGVHDGIIPICISLMLCFRSLFDSCFFSFVRSLMSFKSCHVQLKCKFKLK